MTSIVWRNSESQWQEYQCSSCSEDGYIDEWISLSSPPPDGSMIRLKSDKITRFGVVKDGVVIESKKIEKAVDAYDEALKKLAISYANRWDYFWAAISLPQHAMWIACKCGVDKRKILKSLFDCISLFSEHIFYANDRLLTNDFIALKSYFYENKDAALDECAFGLVPYFGDRLDLIVEAQGRIVNILRDAKYDKKVLSRDVSPFMGIVSLAQFNNNGSDYIKFQKDALDAIKSNISCFDLVVGHGKIADRKPI